MATAAEQEVEREKYARGLAQGALGGREGVQAIEDAVTGLVVELLTIHERTIATKNALLKENAQLRDQIAGNARALPDGVTLAEQHQAVVDMVNQISKRCQDGTLKSIALLWDEGKAIVLHAKADKPKLIEIASKIPPLS